MKILKNGVYREVTDEELCVLNKDKPISQYNERVVNRIRERYTIDDELALLRQRDTKPEEFDEYNAFVENIKAKEREA